MTFNYAPTVFFPVGLCFFVVVFIRCLFYALRLHFHKWSLSTDKLSHSEIKYQQNRNIYIVCESSRSYGIRWNSVCAHARYLIKKRENQERISVKRIEREREREIDRAHVEDVRHLRTHHRNAYQWHSFPNSPESFIILSEVFDIWTVIFMIMLCHTTTCVPFWCVFVCSGFIFSHDLSHILAAFCRSLSTIKGHLLQRHIFHLYAIFRCISRFLLVFSAAFFRRCFFQLSLALSLAVQISSIYF